MPQVEVPGQGVLEFPEGMGDDQIKDVIKRKFFSPEAQGAQALAFGEAQRQQAVNQAQYMVGLGIAGTKAPYTPQPTTGTIPTTFGRIPSQLGQASVPAIEPPLSQTLQELAQKVPPGQTLPTQMLSGAAKAGIGLGAGLVDPTNLGAIAATMVFPPAAAATLPYFTYQMGKGTVESVGDVINLMKQTGPVDAAFKQKLADALINAEVQAAGAGELGVSGLKAGAGLLRGGTEAMNQQTRPVTAPPPVVAPDEIMAALQRRQIVREEPQPGTSTSQPVAPQVQGPPAQAVAPTAPSVAPVVQPAVPAPVTQQAHPPLDFTKQGVGELQMAPIGSVRVEGVPPPQPINVRPERQVQQEQARLERQAEQARPEPPAQANPLGLRPAVITMGGGVVVGHTGQTHDDIIAQEKLGTKDIDSRVFVDKDGNMLSREQAALATPGIPTGLEPGRRHASELPQATQQPPTPDDTQSQRGIQGGIPQGQVAKPDVQVPVSGEQTPPTGGVLQAPKEVAPTPTPLRQEVEKQSDFLHDLNNLAGLIKGNKDAKRITQTQATQFKVRATKVNDQLQAGEINQAEAQRRIGIIREDIANQVSLGEELGPQEAPELAGPRLMEKLGLRPGRGGSYNTEQLLGTLRNKLNPSEWAVYKDLGIEKAFGTNVKGEDVVKWMRENGPRVEVRTKSITGVDYDEANSVEQRMGQIEHWLETTDSSKENWEFTIGPLGGRMRLKKPYEQIHPVYAEEMRGKVDEYNQLSEQLNRLESTRQQRGEGTSWQSIAPKPESEMPGYVEGAVVLPQKTRPFSGIPVEGKYTEPAMFPSSHSFPPNTLAFFRGYMETRPDGGKTFHVIEVQSDWAQQLREKMEKLHAPITEGGYGVARTDTAARAERMRGIGIQEHPLLKHYESLALKAAIEHAKKEGATHIAVSDAPTAMMTEGHDRRAIVTYQPGEYDVPSIRRIDAALSGKVRVKPENIADVQMHDGRWVSLDSRGYYDADSIWQAIRKVAPSTTKAGEFEPGMRLHYDRTLPSILKELTGSEGKKVDFGPHKMAFQDRGPAPFDVEPGEGPSRFTPRKDLIFREPSGEPKTSVTATEFPLAKTRDQFTLFGSDRPLPSAQQAPSSSEREADIARFKELQGQVRTKFKETGQFPTDLMQQMENIKNKYKGFAPGTEPQESPSRAVHKVDTTSLTPYAQSALSELGIKERTTAHNAIENIANNPSKFGSRNSELARFLADNFEHVLRSTGIDLGTGRSRNGLPNYDPIDNTVYLGANLADVEHPLSHAMLEEAAHAATYWQIEHPVTDLQKRASESIKSIMEKSKSLMPDSDVELIGEQPYGLPYRHSSLSEFVAGMFSDPSLRRHLESFSMEGTTAWQKMVDWVKDVLGIKKGTALDKAFEELIKVGQEKASLDPNRRLFDLDPISAPQPGAAAAVIDRTLDEKIKGNYNKWRGYTVPKHVAAGEEVANRLVRYASARVAAPEVSKWMATDVLGTHWKDQEFSRKLGSVLVEDRLRAIKSTFQKLADAEQDPVKKSDLQNKANAVRTSLGMPGSALPDEAAYRAALQDSDIQASLVQHRNVLGPMTERMHEYLGGELAEKGEDTGAFVNLIAMLTDPNNPGSVPSAKELIYGATRGNLANPRVRSSVFSKEAKGTGVGYEFDYRKIAERMVRGNYEQYALRRYYEQLVEQGLAVEAKPGTEPPKTLKGQPLSKIEIKPGRAFIPGKNLWVRSDLANEMRRALDVDKVDNVGLKLFTDLATDLQVIGPTDAAWHTINMLAVIAGSQGAKSMWYDAIRKTTPVGVIDGLVRMTYNTAKAIMDTPDVQKIVAEYSAQGAGRAKPIHQGGVVSKVVSGITDIPLETTRKYDPFHYLNVATSSLIKAIDKGGRVTASKMFDNLVARGMVEDTELQRREFINRMGQYNSRLMPQWQQIMRENSLSAFVVAGKNMNRQAIRRIIMSPGFKAANPEAFAKSRIIEAASLAAMVYALPAVFNYYLNGSITPRAGVPIGGIDLGTTDKDGKPEYFDPLQLLLIRRGLRITGIQTALQAKDEELGTTQTARQVVNDIFQGYIHPWAGPSVRTGAIALTGRDVSGYLESRNPSSLVENVWAAVKNINPTVAAFYRDSESGQAGPKSAVRNLAGAVGMKKGRAPSQIEQLNLEAQRMGKKDYQALDLSEKVQAERKVEESKSPRGLLSERAGAYRQLGEDFSRQDALYKSLPQSQRDWATKNKLDLLKGFANEVSLAGTKLPATPEYKDFMLKAVGQEYSKVLDQVMKMDSVPTQKVLDRFLDAARARARVRLKLRMSGQTDVDAVPTQ